MSNQGIDETNRPEGGTRMRRRNQIVTAVVLAVALAIPASALAAKGGGKGKPPPPPDDTVWTCQARVENGATGWNLGSWDETTGDYTADALAACIDLLAEHTGPRTWTVTWEGTIARDPRGLKMVFETEVHGTVHYEEIGAGRSGAFTTDVLDPAEEGFVFVAMPNHKDRWETFTVTVTPGEPVG
jgi:hypothetical protein